MGSHERFEKVRTMTILVFLKILPGYCIEEGSGRGKGKARIVKSHVDIVWERGMTLAHKLGLNWRFKLKFRLEAAKLMRPIYKAECKFFECH